MVVGISLDWAGVDRDHQSAQPFVILTPFLSTTALHPCPDPIEGIIHVHIIELFHTVPPPTHIELPMDGHHGMT